MTALGLRLTRLLGVALGLGLGYFDTMFSEPMTFVRLLHYEAVQSDLAKGVMGAGTRVLQLFKFYRIIIIVGGHLVEGDSSERL